MATENDIVLIYLENKPLAFARIEDIRPDIKKNWYQIRLLLLQLPLQTVTWILKDAYINGADFTMAGKPMRLEKVVAPKEKDIPPPDDQKTGNATPGDSSAGGKIIPLTKKEPKHR